VRDADGYEVNSLLRAVIVARAGGRGARTPLAERVRVLAYDADIDLPADGRSAQPIGIRPIRLPDLDDPRVLGMPGSDDGAQRGGGA
jgi:hypothetical protein